MPNDGAYPILGVFWKISYRTTHRERHTCCLPIQFSKLLFTTHHTILLQEHHLRAQQAVGRLQEQLDRHPTALSLKNRDSSASNIKNTESDNVDTTIAETTHDRELLIRNLLARQGAAESSPGNGDDGHEGSVDRVAELSRNVDGLQIHQWIQTTRTQACDHAETLAREACEDIKRGAGSAAMGEMEGELDGFAQELNALLLRIDRADNDDREEEGGEGNSMLQSQALHNHHPPSGLAPVADAHVDRAASE